MAIRPDEILAALTGGAARGLGAYQQEQERGREQAATQARAYQSAIGAALGAQQGQQAAQLVPRYTEAMGRATGTQLPTPNIVGGAMPDGGRNFNNPQTFSAIRAAAGLPQPEFKPLEVSAGATVLDPRTGRVIYQAPFAPSTGLSFDQRLALLGAQQGFQAQQNDLNRSMQRDVRAEATAARQGAAADREAQRAAQDFARRQAQWDAEARAYIDKELSAAEARAKAQGGGQVAPPPPNATPDQIAAWTMQQMVAGSGAKMGLTEGEREQMRVKLMQDFQRLRGTRPQAPGGFRAPGQSQAGPLAPGPQ